jgi:hypothetical protein
LVQQYNIMLTWRCLRLPCAVVPGSIVASDAYCIATIDGTEILIM